MVILNDLNFPHFFGLVFKSAKIANLQEKSAEILRFQKSNIPHVMDLLFKSAGNCKMTENKKSADNFKISKIEFPAPFILNRLSFR